MGKFWTNERGEPKFGRIILIIASIVAVVWLLLATMVVVEAGHVGVVDFLGNVDDNEFEAGFHIKNPLASVKQMSIKTQEYTMTYTQGEGSKVSDDSIVAITKEGLNVGLDMTVLYSLQPSEASEVYKTIQGNYVSVIVRPQIRTAIREVVAGYEAKQLYSQAYREEASIEIYDKLFPELEDRGIVLERVLIRHIQLPDKLTVSIEKKLTAEQEAEEMVFVLQKETQEAERKRIEADGIADAQEIINQELTVMYNQYLAISMMKELVNSDNTVFLFIPTSTEGVGMPNIILPN